VGKLWNIPMHRPVPPRPVEAMTGLDEQRLGWYRAWPVGEVASDIVPILDAWLNGKSVYEFQRQQARLAGISWFEREQCLTPQC
jgi:hypothetical protein